MGENVKVSTTLVIRVFLYDGTAAITGETPALYIERLSDGNFWNGAAWQGTPITVTMTAVTPTGNDHTDGVYEYSFTTESTEQEYDWSVTHTIGARELHHRGRIRTFNV